MVVDGRRFEVDSAKLFGAENAQLAALQAVSLSRANRPVEAYQPKRLVVIWKVDTALVAICVLYSVSSPSG